MHAMLKRRNVVVGGAAAATLAALPWLTGCTSGGPLRVGIHPWIGYETLNLAREFNWLPAEVELQRGKSSADSLAGLIAGTLDAACLTLDEALEVRANGVELTVALVFDVSAGADVVMVRPSIAKLAGLAGKRIGVEQNTLGDLVLGKLLEAAGLNAADVHVVNLSVDKQPQAWRNNEIDAAVTYEPLASELERAGALRLYDSRQMPDLIFDVLAVRADVGRARSELLQQLIAGHFRGLAHVHSNRQDALFRIAARQGVVPEVVQKALSGVVMPSLEANRGYLAGNAARLIRAAQTLSALMVQRGKIKAADSMLNLTSPAWLPANDN
jgi:NitT/TauT family transport system substrate-binding protein